MKPFFLLMLLSIISRVDICAQTIILHPGLFKEAHKSLLVLSDDDGQVFTAEVIDSATVTDVYTFQAPPENRGQKMHFTFINEFSQTTSKGFRYFYLHAYTSYNVPDSISFESLPEVTNYRIKPEKTITMLIDGVNSVESVTALSPHETMTRYFNKNTNTLEIRIKTAYDVIINLNCNGEEKTRWLEITNPPEDAGLIEFEALPVGAKQSEIKFPEKADWEIFLRENRPEGFKTIQEFRRSGTFEQDKYAVLLSENIPTEGYSIRAERYTDKKQNRHLGYDWNMKDLNQMPKVDVADFDFKFKHNSNGFEFKGKGKGVQQQKGWVWYINGTYSSWVVTGTIYPEMKFTFPDISGHIEEHMTSKLERQPFRPIRTQIIQEFANGNRVYLEQGVN